MKKLMAFDLDGTLLFDREIEPANVQAIHRWQQAGNIAVCATGKSIFATKLALDTADVTFDYNVLYTGAVVTDAEWCTPAMSGSQRSRGSLFLPRL